MSKQQANNKPQILRPIKKMVNKKAGPTENLQFEMLKDKAVGDYLRITLGIPGGKPSEMILHHPIGIVPNLDDDDWVLSSPEEISQMKSRSKDPNFASIQAKRTKHIREKAVKDKQLEVHDGAVFYHGHKDKEERSVFLDNLKKEMTKKHENEKDYKYILDLALNETDQSSPLVKAEQDYRKWVKPIQKEAEVRFPQTFRTAKGPLEDVQQTGIAWLKGQKITEVGSRVIQHGIAGPAVVSDTTDNDDFTIDPGSGAANQWFFCRLGDRSKKREIREEIAKIRKDHGLNFRILIEDA
jgi:hypothetical protein